MSKESLIASVDIGSSNIRVIIVQESSNENPRVMGVASVPSFGVRRGIIIDTEEVTKGVIEAVEKSERMAGLKIRKVLASIGGSDINFQHAKGVVAVGRADGEVVENDVQRVLEEVHNSPLPLNKEIIHIVPKSYRLDDQENINDPLGMKGVRLEVDALLIEGSSTQIKNVIKSIEQANIEVEDIVLEPLAAAKSVLSKKQKELGVVLIDIGGGTSSIAVFEGGDLIHTAVVPLGSGHITNDIAIGLRVSIETAEKVKLKYGVAIPEEVGKKEEIDLSKIDSQEEGFVSRFHVAEIIEARFEEIFKLVNKELHSIKRANLLPAGAVLTGGGSKMPFIAEIAKKILGLPVQIGFPKGLGGMVNEIDDSAYATAVGLVLWAREQSAGATSNFTGVKIFDNLSKNADYAVGKMKKWFGKFLP